MAPLLLRLAIWAAEREAAFWAHATDDGILPARYLHLADTIRTILTGNTLPLPPDEGYLR
jgi:hypothetical protein